MTKENIIKVENLGIDIGDFSLKDISFNLPYGTIIAFIGNNGSGKSVILKALLNIIPFYKGTVTIFNEDIKNKEKWIKNKIAFVFDDGYFYENMSLNNMATIISSGYTKWNQALFNRYLQDFELDGNREISSLSKGMKMKFSLAISLSHDADLLIMDEPTNGLDLFFREELIKVIKEYIEGTNKTLLFSTHITTDISNFVDHFLIIHNRKIVFNSSKEELFGLGDKGNKLERGVLEQEFQNKLEYLYNGSV